MEVKCLKTNGYNTKVFVKLPANFVFSELFSPEYVIDGLVRYQIRTVMMVERELLLSGRRPMLWVLLKFVNITNGTRININLNSNALIFSNININADSNWHLVPNRLVTNLESFDISITVQITGRSLDKIEFLFTDDELTDFELRGDDGSVRVHKFILAAASPVLQTLMETNSKEKRDGYIRFEGMSRASLQEIKRYIYLNDLPSTPSEQMMFFAIRYRMKDIEAVCIENIVQNLEAEQVPEYLEYAILHKIERLTEAILECVQYGYVKTDSVNDNKKDTQNKKS